MWDLPYLEYRHLLPVILNKCFASLEEISLMPSLFTHATRNKCAVKMRGAGERELQKQEISSSSLRNLLFIAGQDLVLAIVFRE